MLEGLGQADEMPPAAALREFEPTPVQPTSRSRRRLSRLAGRSPHLVEAAFHHAAIDPDDRPAAHRDPRPRRLQEAIEDRLGDAELSVARLCRLLGTSRSNLYAITWAAGTGVERLILKSE